MAEQWEILRRDTAYQGYFRVDRYRLRHRRFDGGWTPVIDREVFERGHAAAVLPWDPASDRILLIEQFRIGAIEAPGGPWLLELVAGIIEPGESPEAVARREANEEAGIALDTLLPICEYLVSPGGTSERTSLFLGRADLSAAGGIHGLAAEQEDIRVHVVSAAEAIALVDDGRANNAATLIALNWFARHHSDLRQRWC